MRSFNHKLFVVSLLVKVFDGALEIIGSILLWFIDPVKTPFFIRQVFRYELLEDPNDFILNHLLVILGKISPDIRLFSFLYLLSHGLVKVFLVFFLFRKKLWAYPAAEFILVFFVGYQTYLYLGNKSALLLLLNIIDVLIIYLIWQEYRNIKKIGFKEVIK